MTTSPRRALIVIDVQNEYVTGDLPIEYPPVQDSLAAVGRAIDAARANSVPVIVVQHVSPATSPLFARGSDGAALHPVVASRPYDHLIEKTLPSAFAGTWYMLMNTRARAAKAKIHTPIAKSPSPRGGNQVNAKNRAAGMAAL